MTGHQLHYDSDDEGQGGIRNPIFTSVLYLNPNTSSSSIDTQSGTGGSSGDSLCGSSEQSFIGGPTLVTDQVLGGGLATKGWLSYPAVNRFTMFDGRYLHGECMVLFHYGIGRLRPAEYHKGPVCTSKQLPGLP